MFNVALSIVEMTTTSVQQQIALTWDQAYSQGFRCGEERGFARGYDAATKEVQQAAKNGNGKNNRK